MSKPAALNPRVSETYETIRSLSAGHLAHFTHFDHGTFLYEIGVEAGNIALELQLKFKPDAETLRNSFLTRAVVLQPFDEQFRSAELYAGTRLSIFDHTESETTTFTLASDGEWVEYGFEGKESDQ